MVLGGVWDAGEDVEGFDEYLVRGTDAGGTATVVFWATDGVCFAFEWKPTEAADWASAEADDWATAEEKIWDVEIN